MSGSFGMVYGWGQVWSFILQVKGNLWGFFKLKSHMIWFCFQRSLWVSFDNKLQQIREKQRDQLGNENKTSKKNFWFPEKNVLFFYFNKIFDLNISEKQVTAWLPRVQNQHKMTAIHISCTLKMCFS